MYVYIVEWSHTAGQHSCHLTYQSHYFLHWKTFWIYAFSNFEIYSTLVLTMVTMLCNRSQKISSFSNCNSILIYLSLWLSSFYSSLPEVPQFLVSTYDWKHTCGTCLSVYDLFHLAWCIHLSKMAEIPSFFFKQNSIALCVYVSHISIHSSMDG